ncbi:hypothetical protein C7T94_16570 [Pedobacter yulinensis]|uniref:Lipoprotein n=1 Tax=Pedobacter yulinensis TaxID=2126353 RepID=A0A2T3HIX8_9SPHI|nr:hypothetical protein [Pedobacter yulinensis]PST82389.1 hypothetical protein C7T94_16570 [Pedobacter yulinensis]
MKKVLLAAACALGVAVGCNNDRKPTSNTELADSSTAKSDSPIEEAKCYTYIKGKDTAQVHLITKDQAVTGHMLVSFFEKDRNSGALTGRIVGDTIIADYKFMSEGVESVRQVAFLKQGGKLVEGYAEITEQDGKMVFKNTHDLKFDSKFPLTETECPTSM